MKQISEHDYQDLVEGAELLKKDTHGDKVWRLVDGRIAKLFRVKRRISSARLSSYAKRFKQNSEKLKRRGIQTITVDEYVECKEIERQIIIYHYLPGETLEELFSENPDSPELIEKFARFLARLHGDGIYFRSVHMGNVVLCENGELGIIDITDIRFSIFALRPWQRARNFYHMLRRPLESGVIHAFGISRFIDTYLETAKLSSLKKILFLRYLPRSILQGPLTEKA